MTTERLSILAAAAALGEFTAPELVAYTGANPNTVRQVLRREQQRSRLFQRTEGRRSGSGRPAVIWRLKDADAIFEEIAAEESRVAELQGSTGRKEQNISSTRGIDRVEVYLASAEEAVIRSYEVDDPWEQEAFARIALNLLEAANPQPEVMEDENFSDNWWAHEPDLPELPTKSTLTPLETVSRVRIGAALPSFNESLIRVRESSLELIRRRAQRIAAFASISARQAEALPIGSEYLTRAAEAISEGSRVLPVHQTLVWIKLFVDISIKSVNAPPVAVLTTAERSPNDLFPVARGDWRKLRAPSELADTGYVLWVEGWAESLLTSSLIPGVVVSHDDSPASNEALSQVMTDAGNLVLGRAIVIASTGANSQVIARVAASGGIYYPVLHDTVAGLLPVVSLAVAQALNSTPPDLVVADASRLSPGAYLRAFNQDLIRAISPIEVQPSDLEVTRRALAALDTAIAAYRHLSSEQEVAYSDLVDVFDSLSAQWPDPGRSREAIAAMHESLNSYLRIVELRSDFLYAADRNAFLASRALEVGRQEAHDALAWAYRELQNQLEAEPSKSTPESHLTLKEREVAALLANGKTPREIGDALAISYSAARKRVANIGRKLGFKSTAEVAAWATKSEEAVNNDGAGRS